MSIFNQLSDRYQDILKATIKHYVATAEPVGSKTLLQEYDFSVSSATIRNVMGKLEKAGLLYQPHTSAGRIPSDSGYRIYVDQLMTLDESFGQKLEASFDKQLKLDTWSFEALLQKAAQILSMLSGYIALITMPQATSAQLRHLQLVQVNQNQVMLILVTDGYQSQSILIDTKLQEFNESELQILTNFLNTKLRGRYLWELTNLDWSELDRDFNSYAQFCQTLFKELTRRADISSSAPLVVHGLSHLLQEPEFSQLEQIQNLLYLLEQDQKQLWPLIFELPDPDRLSKRVKIIIGAENPLEQMRPCAMISAVYRQGKVPVGSVGIIGPTRMFYENAIPLVESAAEYLSAALS